MTASASEDVKYSNLVKEIMEIVQAAWVTNQTPVVLALVGSRFSDAAKDELKASGGKLKSFIRLHMRDQLRSMYSSDLTDVVAPLPETNGYSDTALLSLLRSHLKKYTSEKRFPLLRFKSEVWKGFTSPMTTAERYIHVLPSGDVALLNGAKTSEEGDFFPIGPENLAFDEAGGRLSIPDAVQRVKDWADNVGVDVELLYDREFSAQVLKERVGSEGRSFSIGLNTIDRLLETLSQDDLSRISIPADIVAKIYKAFK